MESNTLLDFTESYVGCCHTSLGGIFCCYLKNKEIQEYLSIMSSYWMYSKVINYRVLPYKVKHTLLRIAVTSGYAPRHYFIFLYVDI